MSIRETCSVCGKGFDVQLRWQMEERDGAYSFFCTRPCHEASLTSDKGVACDACGKKFVVELVSQVIASKTSRRYACSLDCRELLVRDVSTVSRIAPEPISDARVLNQASGAEPPRARTGTMRLAVFNHKGGTGKTTTAVSVAAGLAARGKRVLLVDTDAQGNVAASLGVRCEKTLYHVLVMGLAPAEAAVPVRANRDVLGSNETLAAAELYLAGRRERDRVLRERLASTAQLYDVVVLDCSPSLSLMNQNALVFADELIIPVACDYLSLVGVRQVLKTVKNVNTLLHHPVRIGAVVPTMYDARAKICQDALSTLREHFGDRCLPPVRATAKIKEAPANHKTIYEWAEGSNAAKDYDVVVDAILRTASENTETPGATSVAVA
ncbi:MAG: ParA family protein [Polyangiales bacterium]